MSTVVKLLKELKATAIKDGEAMNVAYMRYACWCENTSARKAKDLTDAETTADELKRATEVARVKAASAANTVADNEKIKAEAEAEVKRATDQRKFENEKFKKDVAETEAAIDSVSEAIKVLSGAGTKTEFLSLKNLRKSAHMAGVGSLQLDVLSEFSDSPQAFLQSAYAPQSETIQGILVDMKDTFEATLKQTKDLEKDNLDKYNDLMDIKNTEIANAKKAIEKHSAIQAEQDSLAAAKQEEWNSNDASYKADVAFFDNMKKTCNDKKLLNDKLKSIRQQELTAVDKALEILDSDENRKLFTKSNDGFLQVASWSSAKKQVVSEIPAKYRSKIALIALKANTGSDALTDAIDNVIKEMDKEEQEDIEQRDDCIQTRQNLNMDADKAKHQLERLDREKTSLEATKKELEDKKDDASARKAATQKDLDAATSTRGEENAAFRESKQDDEDALVQMRKALKILKGFYDNYKLLQQPSGVKGEFEVSADQAPEFGGDFKGTRGKSNAVLDMIQQIIENTVADMEKAAADEAESLESYEKFKKESEDFMGEMDALMGELDNQISETTSSIEKNESENGIETGNLDSANSELENRKPDCDWIMGAFERRAAARTAERKGLNDAKATIASFNPTSDSAAVADAVQASSGTGFMQN